MTDDFQVFSGEVDIRNSNSSRLSTNLFILAPRRLGENWQRKMWFDGQYYWRARYDFDDDEIKVEFIAKENLESNVWTENTNAAIDCSGFDPGCIEADFTIRGAENGIPTTIHFSDGEDTWVAESDESSLTAWSWENLTMVFDTTLPDFYCKVNLCADRKTPIPKLWATAVFHDVSEGKESVKGKRQTSGGDLTSWGVEEDIGDVDNLDSITGQSCRAMNTSGPLVDDVLFVWKEGIVLKSRYWGGNAFEAIQTIDSTTSSSIRGEFDLEHGMESDSDQGIVIYVDADRSIKWTRRPAGKTEDWTAAEILTVTSDHPRSVAIVEWGTGWMFAIWGEENLIRYRIYIIIANSWIPPLENPSNVFDVSIDAVISTLSFEQGHSPDHVPGGEAIPLSWIGETPSYSVGWGVLVTKSNENLPIIIVVRQTKSSIVSSSTILRREASRNVSGSFYMDPNSRSYRCFVVLRKEPLPIFCPKLRCNVVLIPNKELSSSLRVGFSTSKNFVVSFISRKSEVLFVPCLVEISPFISKSKTLSSSFLLRNVGIRNLACSVSTLHDSHRLLREDDFTSWLTFQEGEGNGSIGLPIVTDDSVDKFSGNNSLKIEPTVGSFEKVRVGKEFGI